MDNKKGSTFIYTIENLDCANCGNEVEKALNKLDFIENATLTFATKQLKVTFKQTMNFDPIKQLQIVCEKVEPSIRLSKKTPRKNQQGNNSHKNDLPEILLGTFLFVIANVLNRSTSNLGTLVYVISYIILAKDILIKVIKNLKNKKFFDENFLMSIATIGAFIIKQYPEAVGVMLFFRIGEFFEHNAVEKSRKQIIDSLDLCPETVQKINGENIETLNPGDIKIGDIILVRPGDRIPLDGTIVDGESQIDTSAITGEPVPVTGRKGDTVVSGCLNNTGVLKICVEKLVEDSMVTRILNAVENAVSGKPKIDRFITRFSKIYTPIILVIAIITAIIPPLVSGNWYYWIYTSLTFLVISCPCALVLSVPLAFFSGIGAGSKKGILFKSGLSLEFIKDIKCIVFDKTGTITKGNFVIQKLVPLNGFSEKDLIEIASGCEINSTHPIATSIMDYTKKNGISGYEIPNKIEEISGKGIKASISKGDVLCGNKNLIIDNKISLENVKEKNIGTEIFVSLNNKLVGYIVISDTIKPESKEAVKSIKSMGIKTAMLTGDTEKSANEVANYIDIEEVHSKLLPQDKMDKLIQIRNKNGSTMFVGDGINDAPVLASADVGCAMGSGSDIAIETADVVFITSNLSAIPDAISISKMTMRISKQNITIAISIKIIILLLGILGYASMWLAVFADTGVSILCILNSIRILYRK